MNLTVTLPQPLTMLGLIVGGVLPLSLCKSRTVLIDRNILNHISSRPGSVERQDSEANAFWIKYLNDAAIRINPILCAMEGNSRRSPTYSEMVAEYEAAEQKICLHLGRAGILGLEEQQLRAAYNHLCSQQAAYNKSVNFLVEVAPLIVDRKKRFQLQSVEDKILAIAEANGVRKFSWPVVAALACLYEHESGDKPAIGRGVIKPKASYSIADAHNTLSDFRALELLSIGHGIGITDVVFITSDRNLANLWCSLKCKAGTIGLGSATIGIELNEELFPRLSGTELDALYNRLCE